MERITVVKIGGNVIDSPEATARFVEAFAALEGHLVYQYPHLPVKTSVQES